MRIYLSITLISGIIFAAGGLCGITLSENGRSNYSIVVSVAASPSEVHGAGELQHFLQIITAAYLPIRRDNCNFSGPAILVGKSFILQKIDSSINFRDLGDEGFIIKTVGSDLILAGGRLRGSMYAVYTFLEKIGCRWYTPEVSKIPSISKLTIDSMNEVQKPAFAYREPFWFSAFDGDWAARNKCNSSRANLDEKRGGKFQYWGGHSFYLLVSPEKYYGDHPEYYSLINGKRIWEYSQLCLTDRELVKLMTANVTEVIKREPEYNVYEISQNDWTNWCSCSECKSIDDREESHAGSIVNFVNLVADRVKKIYPEKLIGTFAYWYSEKAPKTITARDNVCVRLCNIEGCDAHALTDCPLNLNRFAKNMKGWRRLAKNIIIWDYVTDFSHYLQPYPNWYATWKDIQYFRENNVMGIFEEGAAQSKGAAAAEIEAYLQAKNLWNPDLDYRDLLNDFLVGYYHKAAPAVRRYMDFLQEKVDRNSIHFRLASPPTIELFSPENVSTCERYLDEAARLAGDDPEALYRVEEVRFGVRYVRLARPVEHVLDGNMYKVPSSSSYANMSELNSFIEDLKKHRITAIRENGTFENACSILRANVSNHKVVTLENPYLRADFIPDLGGKIYRIIDKKTSQNYLRIPAPDEYSYSHAGYLAIQQELTSRSLIGGSAESPAYTDRFFYVNNSMNGFQTLKMEAYLFSGGASNSIKAVRTITVPSDKNQIEISSVLECLIPVANPVGISPGFVLSLGDAKSSIAGCKMSNQKNVWKSLRVERDDRNRAIPTVFSKKELEGGTCIVYSGESRRGIMCAFNPDLVANVSAIPDTATNSVFLSIHGNKSMLKAGDKISLSYKIIPINNVNTILKNNQ